MSFQFELQSEFNSQSNPVLLGLKQAQQPFWQISDSNHKKYLVAKIKQKEAIVEVGILELTQSSNETTKHIITISNSFVTEQWHSRGVFKFLLETSFGIANDNHCVKLRITLPDNKMVGVAKQLGFKIIGQLEKEYFWNNSFWSAILLEKFI